MDASIDRVVVVLDDRVKVVIAFVFGDGHLSRECDDDDGRRDGDDLSPRAMRAATNGA